MARMKFCPTLARIRAAMCDPNQMARLLAALAVMTMIMRMKIMINMTRIKIMMRISKAYQRWEHQRDEQFIADIVVCGFKKQS
jgi:hypothetical protein